MCLCVNLGMCCGIRAGRILPIFVICKQWPLQGVKTGYVWGEGEGAGIKRKLSMFNNFKYQGCLVGTGGENLF